MDINETLTTKASRRPVPSTAQELPIIWSVLHSSSLPSFGYSVRMVCARAYAPWCTCRHAGLDAPFLTHLQHFVYRRDIFA